MGHPVSLMLPVQLPADTETSAEEVQEGLANAGPIPTQHGDKEAPMEILVHLTAAELVYVRMGGSCPPWPSLTQDHTK